MSQPSWGSQNFENVDSCSYDWSTLISTLNMTASMDSLNSTEIVYELDGNSNVVLQGRIGQVHSNEIYFVLQYTVLCTLVIFRNIRDQQFASL